MSVTGAKLLRLCVAAAALCSHLFFGASVARAQGEAETILKRSAERYASLTSYQDRGVVRYELMGWDMEVPFTTAFVRPDQFRFEWTTSHPFPLLWFAKTQSVIRSNSGGSYMWRHFPLKEPTEVRTDSLGLAVAGATGVSSGSAHTIATLLIPDLWKGASFGSAVLDVSNPSVHGEQLIDGTPCVRVQGRTPGGEPIELWIGKDDYLIRKIETFVEGRKAIEERSSPRINQAIPPSVFGPPSAERTGWISLNPRSFSALGFVLAGLWTAIAVAFAFKRDWIRVLLGVLMGLPPLLTMALGQSVPGWVDITYLVVLGAVVITSFATRRRRATART